MQEYQQCECCNKYSRADKFRRVKVIIAGNKLGKIQWWCESCRKIADGHKGKDQHIEVNPANVKRLLDEGKIKIK
jgi:hypothetical protein